MTRDMQLTESGRAGRREYARRLMLSGVAAVAFAGACNQVVTKPPGVDVQPPPLQGEAAEIIGARFLDVDGNIRALGDENGSGPAALVFVDGECPVSADYLAEMNGFAAEAEARGIDFYVVVSSPERTWPDARALRDEYALRAPVLFDPSGDLAARLGAGTVVEAFVVNDADRVVYRGRIDDRHDPDRPSSERSDDLREAFGRVHDPRAELRETTPAGCDMVPWTGADERTVTYTRDMAPILAANCAECHQAGGIAPFALSTYEHASTLARMLERATASGQMPPWRPEPRYGRFRGERYLSQTQIELFRAWAASDGAEGEPGHRPPEPRLPDPGWRHGQPDLVLPMVEPFEVPAEGDDIYRYFVIPSGLQGPRTVTAIDFQAGDPTVVHHANFFADYSGRAREEDAKDDEPGFSVFGTGSFMSYDNTDELSYGIGGWAPGADPYTLPEGVGLWLPEGGDIVIEVHYKLSGRATVDRSRIGFYFADNPTPEYIDGLLIGTQELDIRAGDSAYVRHVHMDVPVGFRLVDAMPHMHFVGTKARMVVTFPDGRQHTVFGIEDWKMRWQNIYSLRTPLHIPAGSRIDAWWVWDNSAGNADNPFDPPRDIAWGWQSEEEMAEVWLGVILDNPSRRRALIRASWETWYNADSQPLPGQPLPGG